MTPRGLKVKSNKEMAKILAEMSKEPAKIKYFIDSAVEEAAVVAAVFNIYRHDEF